LRFDFFLRTGFLGVPSGLAEGGHGGIGAVGAEARFQRGDTLLQFGDASITGAASSHTSSVSMPVCYKVGRAQLRLFPRKNCVERLRIFYGNGAAVALNGMVVRKRAVSKS